MELVFIISLLYCPFQILPIVSWHFGWLGRLMYWGGPAPYSPGIRGPGHNKHLRFWFLHSQTLAVIHREVLFGPHDSKHVLLCLLLISISITLCWWLRSKASARLASILQDQSIVPMSLKSQYNPNHNSIRYFPTNSFQIYVKRKGMPIRKSILEKKKSIGEFSLILKLTIKLW